MTSSSIDKHSGWTRYHVTSINRNQWKFYREGMKRSIATRNDRNDVIKDALYRVANDGGLLTVHYKDGSVDFVVDNWAGRGSGHQKKLLTSTTNKQQY